MNIKQLSGEKKNRRGKIINLSVWKNFTFLMQTTKQKFIHQKKRKKRNYTNKTFLHFFDADCVFKGNVTTSTSETSHNKTS